jgi:two-component system nitrogen regulation sensor histidine kinase NtrY
MGKTGGELVDEGILPPFFSLLKDGSSSRDPFVSSEVDITMDGHTRTIKYMQTRLSTDGRYIGTVYVFEDLTELISSKKLSAWVEMARQIAHEIKNPLTPIKLSTQFMLRAHDEKAENFSEIFKESSETIIQQVEVLRRIASEFSSFGRMQQLEVDTHDVCGMVKEIAAPYQKNDSAIDVSLQQVEGERRAWVDPEAVRKICTNLIENAMEAMTDGGKLQIGFGETDDGGQPMVTVSFRDTGPGLSEEAQQKLFQPYFSTKTTGTGLGLAICRNLSREMGGDVVIENLTRGGAEATLFLRRV